MIDWRQIQKNNFHSLVKLLDFLEFKESEREKILKKPDFPLNLPFRLASKIRKRDLNDPILKQFIPLLEEKEVRLGFVKDPVSDSSFRKKNKLLHKYHGRALLICTSACAMHCRYCFRKNFEYDTQSKNFDEEIALIQKDSSLKEIILSGGDPLSLGDDMLNSLLRNLSDIEHVERIRFHSRFPVGIPERINDSFISLLSSVEKQIIFVLHCNHFQELDDDIFFALKRVQKLGIPVLNQSVLLKDVNDHPDTLIELSRCLINQGVMPYYLHQLDKVIGSHHFEVDTDFGKKLLVDMRSKLPGYGVPLYVKEVPFEKSKTPI
ncbi:MAG: KamA family radical SAM protein [Rhabdochlamydiaceae bacterium]